MGNVPSKRPGGLEPADPPFSDLRRYELGALGMAASGRDNEEIGGALGLKAESVKMLLYRLRIMLGIASERALIAWFWYTLAKNAGEVAA